MYFVILHTHQEVQLTHDLKSLLPLPLCVIYQSFHSASQGDTLLWRNRLLQQTLTIIPSNSEEEILANSNCTSHFTTIMTTDHGIDSHDTNEEERAHWSTRPDTNIRLNRINTEQTDPQKTVVVFFSHTFGMKRQKVMSPRGLPAQDDTWHSEWNISGASASK